MHTRPSQAFLALLEAADGVHQLGAPAVVVAFGPENITIQGSDSYGSHQGLDEWIQGGHAQLQLVRRIQALTDAAHAFQTAVRAHPNLADLLGTGRLDMLWTGQGRALVWVLPDSVDTTIRHSTWPKRANTTKVLAGLRRAERVTEEDRQEITLFHPYALTPEARSRTHPKVVAALAPFLGCLHTMGKAYVLGCNRSVHPSETLQTRSTSLAQGTIDGPTHAAFTTLMGALRQAPSMVEHAFVEKEDHGVWTIHIRTDSLHKVWKQGQPPHPDAEVAGWIDRLLHAWTHFWARLDARKPGLVHHHTTPARLSFLLDGERKDAWLDVFGGCRVDTPEGLAPLLHLRTGPVRAVALRAKHPYMAVPARSQREALSLALAMSSTRWHMDAQATAWDLC